MIERFDALNDALERLSHYRYVDGPGFACHGPMAAEALSTMGHDDRVGGWVDSYMTDHPPIDAPPPVATIDPADGHSWRPALGDFSRVTDWNDMFDGELREQPWRRVLEQWVTRLISGYGGGLTHGLLRTAHAARAMPHDGAPSDLMLGELARGLASWAAWYQALPGEPHLHGSLTLGEAIDRVPRPHDRWSPMEAGTFFRLRELESFPQSVEALGPPDDREHALSDLSAASCRVLLAHRGPIPTGLIHIVTPIAAARTLMTLVPALTIDIAYARLWQVNAALIAGFTMPAPADLATPTPEIPTADAVIARAADHSDPHVVKLIEACLGEHALRPDPNYLLTAGNALTR